VCNVDRQSALLIMRDSQPAKQTYSLTNTKKAYPVQHSAHILTLGILHEHVNQGFNIPAASITVPPRIVTYIQTKSFIIFSYENSNNVELSKRNKMLRLFQS